MIRNQSSIKKSDARTKSILEILITKNVLRRYKAGRGFAIGLGEAKMSDVLPIKARIDEGMYKMKVSIRTGIQKIMELRNRLAEKHGLVPANFINDRVIMNIHEKSPKNIQELWAVDGISNEFIMGTNCAEFMEEYIALNPAKKKKGKTRENVLSFYKKNMSIKEISQKLGVKERTIEGHILNIFEHDDIDIDMDYIGLTDEKENRIKSAIKKVGKDRLRPIKEKAGPNITYIQIQLCLLVMKIESE